MFIQLIGLTVLGYAAWEDWKTHSFKPVPLLLYNILAITNAPTGLTSNIGFLITSALILYGSWKKNYFRPGDTIPVLAYAMTFPSLQGFFTLTTITGLYLALFKHGNTDKEWIPYIPAILISYIIQLISQTPIF